MISVINREPKKVKKEYDEYCKCSKSFLQSEVTKLYRICDTKGADKYLLVSMIMEAKYGRKGWVYEN